MKNDNLNRHFESIDFDIEQPNKGHEYRFLEKLKAQQNENITLAETKSKYTFWKPLIGIAASIVLIISLTFGLTSETKQEGLASVSPEMAETQHFFNTTITSELNKLKEEKSPEVQLLVNDAIEQLNHLETNYEQLKIDLNESGDDKLVIYAMIKNFQNRIDILQNTLEQIEDIKAFKKQNYENTTTI